MCLSISCKPSFNTTLSLRSQAFREGSIKAEQRIRVLFLVPLQKAARTSSPSTLFLPGIFLVSLTQKAVLETGISLLETFHFSPVLQSNFCSGGCDERCSGFPPSGWKPADSSARFARLEVRICGASCMTRMKTGNCASSNRAGSFTSTSGNAEKWLFTLGAGSTCWGFLRAAEWGLLALYFPKFVLAEVFLLFWVSVETANFQVM